MITAQQRASAEERLDRVTAWLRDHPMPMVAHEAAACRALVLDLKAIARGLLDSAATNNWPEQYEAMKTQAVEYAQRIEQLENELRAIRERV